MSSCCGNDTPPHKDKDDNAQQSACHDQSKFDWLFWGSLIIITAALMAHFFAPQIAYGGHFAHGVAELLGQMWWGILFGLFAVGTMQKIPRSLFHKILGRGDTFGGLVRAAIGGLVLDLCSHGILMVGAKLYERGASLAQIMTFLIASPWNSFSLTLILIALIGLKWTLIFIAASAVIALITGLIFQFFERRGILPANPNTLDHSLSTGTLKEEFVGLGQKMSFTPAALFHFFKDVAKDGYVEGRMVLRWLLFGTILAALIRAYVPTEILTDYFGPTMIGLVLTLLATTIIEVCSEGSAPIGAELFNRAAAPGNGFTFLMAGVATDYTEIMVIREFTKRWKTALFLPMVTIPQILVIGYIMNMATP